MTTVLATLVALAFLWSVALFFGAVFYQEREQESGFGWALAGAFLYFIVFADRLPWDWMDPRKLIELLPGVPDGGQLFASSVAALVLLAVVYAFRIAVFYRLLLSDGIDLDGDGSAEVVNDIVAPALSFFCFGICLVSLLQPAYELTTLETTICCGVLLVVYYGRLLYVVKELLGLVEVAWTRIKLPLTKVVVRIVQLIARGELLRSDRDGSGLNKWVNTQLDKVDRARSELAGREQAVYANLARAWRSRGGRRRRGRDGRAR